MTSSSSLRLVDRDEDGVDRAFRRDVIDGLSQSQKAVPARWLYDDAGSQLFEDITEVEEYYPTRAEREILSSKGDAFGGQSPAIDSLRQYAANLRANPRGGGIDDLLAL